MRGLPWRSLWESVDLYFVGGLLFGAIVMLSALAGLRAL